VQLQHGLQQSREASADPRWIQSSNTDADQIHAWWTTWPDANIGIATGAASGLVVVDVDGADGEESLRRFIEDQGQLPDTRTIKTGKGRQLYFRHPGGRVRNAAPIRRDFRGLDSRGDGGYVVAPPSLHYTGRRYALDETASSAIAELPESLISFINGRPPSSGGALKLVVNNDRMTIADGSRNSALASLAGSLRARGLGEAALQAALLEHNREHCSPPLDDDEVRQIARSIASYPPGSPSDVLRTLTDAGNAKRFAQRYAKTIRYVPEWGKWITWQQTHWGIDGAGAVIELAKAAVDAIYDEGNLAGDAELRVTIAKHAKSSASAARLKAMVELASSEGDLVVHATELDRHRGLLGVQNGTLNLSTGKLQPASPDDYITMLAPVAFDAEADCPIFRQFMLHIMGRNQELVDYLQRLFGYALSGYTSEQYLYFFYGTGANGKSTLLAVLRDLLGHRHYLTLPSEAIMVRPGKSGATPELARLPALGWS
jgi:putative DNA primase/helicase